MLLSPKLQFHKNTIPNNLQPATSHHSIIPIFNQSLIDFSYFVTIFVCFATKIPPKYVCGSITPCIRYRSYRATIVTSLWDFSLQNTKHRTQNKKTISHHSKPKTFKLETSKLQNIQTLAFNALTYHQCNPISSSSNAPCQHRVHCVHASDR